MTLIKTSFWTGSSVLIKIIAVFIISKLVALYTGPIGLAIVEQFSNFIQIIRIFSATLMQQGVIKYIAEYRQDENNKSRILSGALIICTVVSLASSAILFYFSSDVALLILQSIAYKKIIRIFSGCVILFSLNSLLLSVLNGELEIKKYVSSNIANTLLTLGVTFYLLTHHGLMGGLLALILNQSIILFFTAFLIIRCKWFKWRSFFQGIDTDILSKLTTYALIAIIITLATSPIS